MTNSKKVNLLNEHGYKLNPFTESMFGEKTYHKEYPTHGISMDNIMKHNKSIIRQSELDLVTNKDLLEELIKQKNKLNK